MEIIKLVVVVLCFAIIWKIIFIPICNWFGVGEAIDISKTEAKYIDKYGSWVMYVVLAYNLPVFLLTGIGFRWFMILVFVMISALDAILEWIYNRENKQYITSILFALYMIVFILNFDYVLIFLLGENVFENV